MNRTNQGRTSLKRRRRKEDRMTEFDRLPAELRRWLSTAMLPWRPRSVRKTYTKALDRIGDPDQALAELDRVERRLIARDAARIWGDMHPGARIEGD